VNFPKVLIPSFIQTRKKTIIFSCILIVCLLIFLLILKVYGALQGSDLQCSSTHFTTSSAPKDPKSAEEFFALGNYDYDIGKCQDAVVAYTKALQLDPQFTQVYNNRAYTQMRLRNYTDAMNDLNKVLSIRPNYTLALINRGDLYNYYGPIIDRKKAIDDYQKAISLGAVHDTSVCGHLAMAQTNNLVPLAILKFIFNRGYCK